MCYASHDSCIHFASGFDQGSPVVQTVKFGELPLCSLLFVAEKAVVGGGHEFNPAMYTNENGSWSFKKKGSFHLSLEINCARWQNLGIDLFIYTEK